jgi:hypothetical protein
VRLGSLAVGAFGLACATVLGLVCLTRGFTPLDIALILIGVSFGLFNFGIGISDKSE